MNVARVALSVLALAHLAACAKHTEHGQPTPSTSASALPLAAASANAAPSTVPHVVQGTPACRALDVVGTVTVEGTPIRQGSLLDGQHWVELEAGSSVALRHTVTSRELRLIGPGMVLPCRNGAEQILIASGRVTTSANLGVRPGAEVLIATPIGTVRYGDAALDLELGHDELRLRVSQGEAWLEPEARGKPRFKNPVHSGAEARLAAPHAAAAALFMACQAAAQKAQQSAQLVLTPADPVATPSLGTRAAAHMRDRAAARVACAMAGALVGATEDPAEKQRLSASVAHADELWQSVPHAATGQKN